jgi:flagellar basal-body rod modification protein FlgD
MAVSGISATGSTASQSAFGLDFQSLLKIILTQLTYQDPLKPLDNFQFVSQLAQFSQLQQAQSLNDQITSLLASQAAGQATSLLGKKVDLTTANTNAVVTGTVSAVSFASGTPQLTITTADGQTMSGVSIAAVSQIRQ